MLRAAHILIGAAKLEGGVMVCDQWGWGYVIGVRGPYKKKILNLYGRANPGDPHRPDFIEPDTIRVGDGRGDTLEPRSLYLDQLERRLGKRGVENVLGK